MAFKLALMVVCVMCAAKTASAGTGFIAPARTNIVGQTIPLQYVQSLPTHFVSYSDNPSQRHQLVSYPSIRGGSNEYDSRPQYKYGYNVQDSISGDSKSQVETRDGSKVNGEYSLIDADGFKRIVKYTSDSINGFNAVVTRIPAQGVANVKNLVSLSSKVMQQQSATEVPYVSRSAQEGDFDPVVKGAYAVKPIVRAVPIAYPISRGHKE